MIALWNGKEDSVSRAPGANDNGSGECHNSKWPESWPMKISDILSSLFSSQEKNKVCWVLKVTLNTSRRMAWICID